MSEKTVKLSGWSPQARPAETDETKFHRQLLTEIVYGLYYKKKEHLAKMGMPPQPISLREIWLEFCSRRAMLDSIKEWKWSWHGKRYIDRRVNEISSIKYSENGIPKVVAVSAGLYTVNPEVFK